MVGNCKPSGEKLQVMGDSKTVFEQPESKIQNEHPYSAPWLPNKETGNSAFYLTNAIQFRRTWRIVLDVTSKNLLLATE